MKSKLFLLFAFALMGIFLASHLISASIFNWSSLVNASYYTFNETTGSTAYDSYGVNNATISGGIVKGIPGVIGTAFNITGGWVYVSSGSDLDYPANMSTASWFYQYGNANDTWLSGEWASNYILVALGNKSIEWGACGRIYYTEALQINAWHYLAMTRDVNGSGNFTLYIDGKINQTHSGITSCSTSGKNAPVAGTNNGGTGGIAEDEELFTATVLTPENITALYNGGSGLPFGNGGLSTGISFLNAVFNASSINPGNAILLNVTMNDTVSLDNISTVIATIQYPINSSGYAAAGVKLNTTKYAGNPLNSIQPQPYVCSGTSAYATETSSFYNWTTNTTQMIFRSCQGNGSYLSYTQSTNGINFTTPENITCPTGSGCPNFAEEYVLQSQINGSYYMFATKQSGDAHKDIYLLNSTNEKNWTYTCPNSIINGSTDMQNSAFWYNSTDGSVTALIEEGSGGFSIHEWTATSLCSLYTDKGQVIASSGNPWMDFVHNTWIVIAGDQALSSSSWLLSAWEGSSLTTLTKFSPFFLNATQTWETTVTGATNGNYTTDPDVLIVNNSASTFYSPFMLYYTGDQNRTGVTIDSQNRTFDQIFFNITDSPLQSNITLTREDSSPYWNGTFSNTSATGTYNISLLWANDTNGDSNSTTSFNSQSFQVLSSSNILVTLNSPVDTYNTSSTSVTFNGTATSYSANTLTNVSIWTNISGTWQINQTNSSPINNSATTFTINGIPNGYYIWNYETCDNSSTCVFASSNRSFTVDTTPPTINFTGKTPTDITTYNQYINGSYFNYTINDTQGVNASNVTFYYKTNSTISNIQYYINGTSYSGYFNATGTNVSNNWTFILTDNKIYPGTYNINQTTMQNTGHTYLTLNGQNGVKIQFLNVSNSTPYNTFEFMANSSVGATPLQIYYCNSTYTSGDVRTNSNCVLFSTLNQTQTFNTTENLGYSYYQLVGLPINTTTGKAVNLVQVTPTSYFVLRNPDGGSWYPYYISTTSRAGAIATTTNNGAGWTNKTYTIDAHFQQFDGDTFYNYVCASDLLGNYACSTIHKDAISEAGLPPSAPEITNPQNQTYSGLINITYDTSISLTGNNITTYNITLLNSDYSYNKTITSNNAPSTSYLWNTTSTPDGQYLILVNATDNESLSSFAESQFFTIDNTIPTVNLTIPSNATFYNFSGIINITSQESGSTLGLANASLYLWYENGTLFSLNTTTISATSNTTFWNYTFPTDNRYQWNVQVCDISDICSFNSTNYTITIDTSPPNITFISPTPANNSYTNSLPFNVSVSSDTPGAPLKTIYVYLYNTTGYITYDSSSFSQSQNTYNYNFSGDFSTFPDGIYYINSSAVDYADNTNTTITLNLTKDTVPPIINLTSPANNSNTSVATNYFVANESDNKNLSNATLYIWTNAGSLTTTSSESITGTSNQSNISYTFSSSGNYTWNVQAYDQAGNSAFNSTNHTLSVSIVTPPTPSGGGVGAPPSATNYTIPCTDGYYFTVSHLVNYTPVYTLTDLQNLATKITTDWGQSVTSTQAKVYVDTYTSFCVDGNWTPNLILPTPKILPPPVNITDNTTGISCTSELNGSFLGINTNVRVPWWTTSGIMVGNLTCSQINAWKWLLAYGVVNGNYDLLGIRLYVFLILVVLGFLIAIATNFARISRVLQRIK